MRKVSLANEGPVIPAHFSIGGSGGGGVPWKHAALGVFRAYFVICKWEGPDKPLYFPETEQLVPKLRITVRTLPGHDWWRIICKAFQKPLSMQWCDSSIVFFFSVYFGNLKPAFESSIATCKIPLSSLPTLRTQQTKHSDLSYLLIPLTTTHVGKLVQLAICFMFSYLPLDAIVQRFLPSVYITTLVLRRTATEFKLSKRSHKFSALDLAREQEACADWGIEGYSLRFEAVKF